MVREPDIPDSLVTPAGVWQDRRRLLGWMGTAALASLSTPAFGLQEKIPTDGEAEPTPEAAATRYNNYYEFSLDKQEPEEMARALHTSPWTIEVTGLVEKPLCIGIDELQRRLPGVERIYRFRCVEGWSAVLPWQGIMLRDLLLAASPLSSARYAAFTAILAPDAMPNQRASKLLEWPYREALRLDEALHSLTLLATGMYGKALPPQNGAPVRLVVPWKYGFKSIKAVVRIELLEQQPPTTWNLQAPRDYGFYANVNPDVPHPRWSQATERPLGSSFFQPRHKTLLFNGYAEQVAHLYSGLDLRQNF